MLRISLIAAALLAGSSAFAAPSNHSFAWTGGSTQGSAVLSLDGVDYTALSRGWVAQNGDNNGGGAVGNYIVGVCGSSDACNGDDLERNNYFVFNLSGASMNFSTAVLKLGQPEDSFGGAGQDGFLSYLPNHTYSLYDVLSDPAGSGTALYSDLGSGTMFGMKVLDISSNGSIVSITLNAAGNAAIVSALDAGGTFWIGGSLNAPVVVPEPATWAMLIAGFGLVGMAMRRRERMSSVSA
ncbi:PEPxxWA-CTERM sorting domain-containing protein [Sandaracinobacteroides saxicola]|uniref:PEPxxWA-CTERM sorting domain-containing protein n=1 Tax=Sandaracinobacteroides saxicola TaxID=2759707 RepID=UPI001FB0C4DD|nr:PEPxxWA-CTERM sorting domain-containing protein [Sandaracinobacteroides saxicola]